VRPQRAASTNALRQATSKSTIVTVVGQAQRFGLLLAYYRQPRQTRVEPDYVEISPIRQANCNDGESRCNPVEYYKLNVRYLYYLQ
jgi:hypothetical protein